MRRVWRECQDCTHFDAERARCSVLLRPQPGTACWVLHNEAANDADAVYPLAGAALAYRVETAKRNGGLQRCWANWERLMDIAARRKRARG